MTTISPGALCWVAGDSCIPDAEDVQLAQTTLFDTFAWLPEDTPGWLAPATKAVAIAGLPIWLRPHLEKSRDRWPVWALAVSNGLRQHLRESRLRPEEVDDGHAGILRACPSFSDPRILADIIDFLDCTLLTTLEAEAAFNVVASMHGNSILHYRQVYIKKFTDQALNEDEKQKIASFCTTPLAWPMTYAAWTQRQTGQMLQEVLGQVEGFNGEMVGLQDVKNNFVHKIMQRDESAPKVRAALADFKEKLLWYLKAIDRHPHPDQPDHFGWKIMSQLLDYTRTESLRSIKKQRPWGAMKRNASQNDELGRQIQATSGYGNVLYEWGLWERRIPVTRDEMQVLSEEAHFRLTSPLKGVAIYRPNILNVLKELSDMTLRKALANYNPLLGSLPLGCDKEQVYSDYIDFLVDGTSDGWTLEHACNAFEAEHAMTCCVRRVLVGSEDSVGLPVMAVIEGDIERPMSYGERVSFGYICEARLQSWRCRVKEFSESEERRIKNLEQTSWTSETIRVDKLADAINMSKEKCPQCRRPLRIETIQISRSDEKHNVVGKCYVCKISIQNGKIYRLS